MALKASLQAINAAISRQSWDDAISQSLHLLRGDPKIFQAQIFLAFALEKKGRYDEAERAYLAATNLRPDDPQPWQGLVLLYENQGAPRLGDAVVKLATLFAGRDDMHRCQDTVDKFIDHMRATGDVARLVDAYSVILPGGPLHILLEGLVPTPARLFEMLIPMIDADDTRRINRLIGERRSRIGARLADTTLEVKREVYGKSKLEHMLRQAIVWTADDEKRRGYEERLIQVCYDKMVVAPAGEQKAAATEEVRSLCRGMVVIRHPFQLAWDIELDWKDAVGIEQWDPDVLIQYCKFFPHSGLAQLLVGYLSSSISPFPPLPAPGAQKVDAANGAAVDAVESAPAPARGPSAELELPAAPKSDADRLVLMTDGIAGTESLFGYRLLGEYYQHLEEYQAAVELMRKAMDLLARERTKTGLALDETDSALSVVLATALVYFQSPRHHAEAKALFDKVLARTPSATPAMVGVGLIYEEEEEYEQAIDFLERALSRDESNLRVRVEAAWVKALSGDYSTAVVELEGCVARFDAKNPPSKELKARTLYGIGYCKWHLDASKEARKSRTGAYAYFVDSLKSNLEFAPSYTMLGKYYSAYKRDKTRATRCFQKAVELSTSEVEAAEHLARMFADEGDWERVELVAQRVVDSGKIKPPPGSKRKGISWPLSALGVAELNKQEFQKAIVSFQAALRISPLDYHSWVGLGESYYSSGRYMAATKAIHYAQKLEEDPSVAIAAEETWFTRHLLANVHRELGEYDEAIGLYRGVVGTRPDEQGVALALLETMAENAQYSVEKGYFGKGVHLALEAVDYAAARRHLLCDTFNYWKAVGDACAIFSMIQSRLDEFPTDKIQQILEPGDGDDGEAVYAALAEIDRTGTTVVFASGKFPADEEFGVGLTRCLHAMLLAHKRAIYLARNDVHAQPAAYYNLGWAEYRTHSCLPGHLRGKYGRYLKASVAAFKRAIELEASNAEFWNALGVVTSRINPAVAQHALVRGLVLNDRSAVGWANLGALALLHSDVQLANEALARAQSTDPDYAHAWVGQAFVAMLLGNTDEARRLFTHASELSESSFVLARRRFPISIFDHVLASKDSKAGLLSLLSPLFALNQLRALQPQDHAAAHLSALLHERFGDLERVTATLETLCNDAEAEYEATESAESLARFALGKTDIARAYLATGRLDDAIEAADTALGLSSDEADHELAQEQRQKARLSANLTVGLARYYQKDVEESISSFEAALEESGGDPDAVCLLAQVLWAAGGDEYRKRAQSSLKELAGKEPSHVQCNMLLSVMALMSKDPAAMRFAQSKLQALRTSPEKPLTECEYANAGLVLGALAQRLGGQEALLAHWQADILLAPFRPQGWTELSGFEGGADVGAGTALEVAEHWVQTAAGVEGRTANAEELSSVLVGTGLAGDAQWGIVLAPWARAGWEALEQAVKS